MEWSRWSRVGWSGVGWSGVGWRVEWGGVERGGVEWIKLGLDVALDGNASIYVGRVFT